MTPESKILIQGITEPRGLHSATQMKAYGTNVVAGVGVGQGQEVINGIPVFDLVEEALEAVGEVEASVLFVKPYEVLDAALEAIAMGIKQLIIATAKVPPLDMVKLLQKVQATNTLILGPGSAGLILPGQMYVGTYEPQFYQPGSIALLSRGEGLSYEVALALNEQGFGESLAVSLGTDDIMGSPCEQWLSILDQNPATEAIVFMGYPYGREEEMVADYIQRSFTKPVVAYIPGKTLPMELNLRDAATIIASQLSSPVADQMTIADKVKIFEQAQIPVAHSPREIPLLLQQLLSSA